MRIEPHKDGFIIVKGTGGSETSGFCFFVDHDSACWSKYNFRVFEERGLAEHALVNLKHRAKIRRDERKAWNLCLQPRDRTGIKGS